MGKIIVLIGAPTTTGGRIIISNQRVTCDRPLVALLVDKTICPKYKSIVTIIEGAENWIVDGKLVAYDGYVIVCKCSPVGHNKIIASHSYMFVDVGTSYNTTTRCSLGNTSSIQSDYTNEESNNLIRIDASRLLKCADELCEKHLYHEDIK